MNTLTVSQAAALKPETLLDQADEWQAAHSRLREHQNNVARSVDSSRDYWQGTTGDAMRTNHDEVAKPMKRTADALEDVETAARDGHVRISAAQSHVLDAVAGARSDGYEINDDGTVVTTRHQMSQTQSLGAMRRVIAQDALQQDAVAHTTNVKQALNGLGEALHGTAKNISAAFDKVQPTRHDMPEGPGFPGGGGGGLDPGGDRPSKPYPRLPDDTEDIGHDSVMVAPNVKTTSKVPLQTTRGQIEAKYKHALDFAVTEPRGAAGFDQYEKALQQEVNDPATFHIVGTYRGDPAILNYQPNSGLCVIQKPDGTFVSGWKLNDDQRNYVLNNGTLGGD